MVNYIYLYNTRSAEAVTTEYWGQNMRLFLKKKVINLQEYSCNIMRSLVLSSHCVKMRNVEHLVKLLVICVI